MFVLSKIFARIFMPLSIIAEMLVLGLFLLLFTRKQALGKTLILLATIIFLGLGYPALPDLMLSKLERAYDPIDKTFEIMQVQSKNPDIQWIVVLGGGHRSEKDLPPNDRLTPSAIARVVEGVRLAQRFSNATLLFCGGPVCDVRPEAESMSYTAISLGVPVDRIVLEDDSLDTAIQAQQVKRIVGDETILLVTSAAHMPRAVALFNKQGVNFIPAPTDHKVKQRTADCSWDVFPDTGNIRKAETAVYEYLGLTWARFTGKIDR